MTTPLPLTKPPLYLLDDEQWQVVASHLPSQYQTRIINNTRDYRAFIEAVLWVVQNNAPWTSLPAELGSWRAIYVRFLRWVKDEHWIAVERGLGLETQLARMLRDRVERYRASNHWRCKRDCLSQAGREAVEIGDIDIEIAKRWGPLKTG